MTIHTRPYQESAIANVEARWNGGARSVCLVAPTGSGKTFMGSLLVGRRRTLWVAHRRELVKQAAKQLRRLLGNASVGVVLPGEPGSPHASVQVGTVQTLLARRATAAVELIVLDECHHYLAEHFRLILDAVPGDARVLGLTAVPERSDGKPLGDVFEQLVVAASYSELIAGEYIVPVTVFRPEVNLGHDLAQDPLDAWFKHAQHQKTFAFFPRVRGNSYGAEEMARRWSRRGVPAQLVEANTGRGWRDDVLELFRAGNVRVLTSVYTLTEGVDVPDARVALSGRSFDHVSTMLQAFGRVLRAAEGKSNAIIIDLCGATLLHGLPTDDRVYSLTGRAISGGRSVETTQHEPFSQKIVGRELTSVTTPGVSAPAVIPEPAVTPAIVDFGRVKKLKRKHGAAAGQAELRRQEKMG